MGLFFEQSFKNILQLALSFARLNVRLKRMLGEYHPRCRYGHRLTDDPPGTPASWMDVILRGFDFYNFFINFFTNFYLLIFYFSNLSF
jgi:hypothetical protein